jgi:hypothetical protein
MKKTILALFSTCLVFSCQPGKNNDESGNITADTIITAIDNGNVDYHTYFEDKTMRMDFYHTGNSESEIFATDKVLSDGPWAGSKKILIDELGLGPYCFEVLDKESRVLLYSRGFANIFGEWQTTEEASQQMGTFHESLRFPWPKKPVHLIIKKRDAQNKFQQIWTTSIDPGLRKVNKADKINSNRVFTILDNGPSNLKLDLVILGDGYTLEEMEKFRKDARRLSDVLLNAEPFKTRKGDMNIRAIETPAMESGVNKPHHGIFKRTPLSASYSSFDSERYVLSYDNRTLRDIASAVPYEFMIILVNERTYGGGGIYNLYTTVSSDNRFAGYIMVHELGHGLAALADEYYTSSVAYEIPEITLEPWERNVTALLDKDNLKWKDLVDNETPIPTPWNKEEFDKFGYQVQKERDSIRSNHLPEDVMESLFIKQHTKEDNFFAEEKYKDKVGAFEGANYHAKGMYRSQLDCIMYTRHMVFCRVCQRSISQVIDQYAQ